MRFSLSTLLGFTAGTCIMFSNVSKATTYRISHTLNNDYWLFGASSLKSNLSAEGDDVEDFKNTSLQISIGKGVFRDKWSFSGSIDLLSGPLEPFFENDLDVELEGFGLTFLSSYALTGTGIRDKKPSFAATFGLNYLSVNGASIGRNKNLNKDFDSPLNSGKINGYSVNLSTLNIVLGTTFNWIEKARPQGNHPDLLKTRLEGYALSILAFVPVYGSMDSKVDTLLFNNTSSKIYTSTEDSTSDVSGATIMLSLLTYISS